MKINYFEARNGYELITAVLFAKKINIENNKNIIFCTNFINNDKIKELNKLENVKFKKGLLPFNNKIINFINILFYLLINIIKIKNIYIFHEVSPVILFHKLKKSISIIEHGESNYVIDANSYSYNKSIYKYFKFKILKNNFIGESKFIKKIYLTDLQRCPKVLIDKAEEFDLRILSKKLSHEELNALNNIYNFEKFDNLSSLSLLLTQPFSELKLITENEKLEIYKTFIDACETEVIIKPHPLEKTDYSLFFPENKIINKNIPIELLDINNVNFEFVISVNSSAMKKLEAKKYIYIENKLLNGLL